VGVAAAAAAAAGGQRPVAVLSPRPAASGSEPRSSSGLPDGDGVYDEGAPS